MASKHHIQFVAVFVAAALLSYGIVSVILPQILDNKENKTTVSGKTLPEASFLEGRNRKRSLQDFKGNVVLVNLWATWCLPCVAELPSLDRLRGKMQARSFKVVAINLDRDARSSTVPAFFSKRKIKHLVPYWDKFREIPGKWTYDGIPVSFLLDRDGNIAEVFKGPYEWDKGDALQKVEELLK